MELDPKLRIIRFGDNGLTMRYAGLSGWLKQLGLINHQIRSVS
jgi:hypothetical protein